MNPQPRMSASQIISDVMAQKRIARADLLLGKTSRHVKARLLTINRLREAGLSATEIARAMNKTREGIMYWLGDEWKDADNAARWNGIADGWGWDTASKSVVIQVCNEHKIYPAELFGGGRDRRITVARREAIRRLDGEGCTQEAIARLLKLNVSSVRYWMDPKYREYCRRLARGSLARSQQKMRRQESVQAAEVRL
jgi:hypothetical protein